MEVAQPDRRLEPDQLWSLVDRQHNAFIAERLEGQRILDLGCGYGTLVEYLGRQGRQVVGIDLDPESLAVARKLHPEREFVEGDFVGRYAEHSFDHVVMRDSWHHLYEESQDPAAVLVEVGRILAPEGTLVIFDPNLNLILRTGRKLIGHRDAECSLEDAERFLGQHGFRVVARNFYELFALALSGGYVGPRLAPPWPVLNRLLAFLNDWLSRRLDGTPLAPGLLWRYCLVAVPGGPSRVSN
ncbi:MAG: class I SAM-dependent methyltransferase [Candidatus Eremiobacteraeota bacterium]|nr:class I SAM-dependent methyltransferase [Candidatus Eremiobacteraeota bacterium]